MAAKAWGSQQQKATDEVLVHNDAMSLCLLINRRSRTMRVIDFRAGPTSSKRVFVLSFAKRESVEKIFTLIERDEAANWVKLGFSKEGTIPAFYKRSDAFLLGCVVRTSREDAVGAQIDVDVPFESETRLAVAAPATAAASPTAHDQMERTITRAKKEVKEAPPKALPSAKIVRTTEVIARKAVALATRSGRALTGFEPFGRDVERSYYVATTRGGFELFASIESQACFGNAYLELLQGPSTPAERLATIAAVRAVCIELISSGAVSCFSLAPSDDVALAAVFLHNGFRRTGLLREQLCVRGQRKDAILWSRKLANPNDDSV